MKWNIPNQLTMARIVLAAIFFVLLGLYTPDPQQPTSWLMTAGFVLYIIAAATDFLDGFLARRWNQVSAFGRMVDPIVDKVLVVGAFCMLTGPNFIAPATEMRGSFEAGLPLWITGGYFTCVQPWMVVVILTREFVISGIRGYAETQGMAFPANQAGKLKMVLQSVAIGSILFCLAWDMQSTWCNVIKIISVWLSVLITVLSGLTYIRKARVLFVTQEEN